MPAHAPANFLSSSSCCFDLKRFAIHVQSRQGNNESECSKTNALKEVNMYIYRARTKLSGFIENHLLLDVAIETLDALARYSGAVTEEVVKVISENVTR